MDSQSSDSLIFSAQLRSSLGPVTLERRSYDDERWRRWRLFKGDKVMDCKTRAQNDAQHHRTEAAGIICTACTWEDRDSYPERTKPCCIILGDADGSVFLPDVSVGVTAPLRTARASVCPPKPPPPPTVEQDASHLKPEGNEHYYLHSHFSQTETGA